MNPQPTSLLTSLLLGVAGIATGWLASHNIIPAADVTTDTATIAAFGTFAAGSLIAWYKMRQVSQKAMITAVNAAPNGVKVVPASVPESIAPTVNAPLAVSK